MISHLKEGFFKIDFRQMIKGLNQLIPPVSKLREEFINAKPYRYICIENFLEPSLAEDLLSQFPSFDESHAKNEFGHVGGKATKEGVRDLGSAYEQVDDLVKSTAFLEYLSELTGIPELQYDPSYFGGGTHDNRHGQELDAHVDFNRDPLTGIYRRLNLLIYLNKEWEPEWGGDIEIHSAPREPEGNQIVSFMPLFNRCVMFETHETSWHGFPLINLPESKRNLSRKSFSVYFYSKHAPECGETPMHSTFYVQRWLPKNIQGGKVLTKEDVAGIKKLLYKRDHWIKYYQDKEIEFSRIRDHLNTVIKTLEKSSGPNVFGYSQLIAPVSGRFNDGWCGSQTSFELKFHRKSHQIKIGVLLPDQTLPGNILTFEVNGIKKGQATINPGAITNITLPVIITALETVTLTVSAESSFVPAAIGRGDDSRSLSWILVDITTEH